MDTTRVTLDPALCARCGGLCCRETPGVWIDPRRFLASFSLQAPQTPAALLPFFATARLAWRDLGGVPVPVPQSDDNGCLLLGEAGCRLPVEQRPCQCLALIPSPETVRERELCCELPEESRLIEARRGWTAYWTERGFPL